ncbi:aspartate/glutamate racemase family protein [Pseudactinotalea terrae]|uniref:aspartate/glutamate racemase family protein n=1 Tax=Pseudactinotalea terrae TaxID=1743262 RepID=UPI0012E1E40B|nr:hypothetical protein [Pseudactinotalea terrae]
MRIGFVHTVPALAAAFERDLQEQVPGAVAVHVVDADLLAHARRTGVDEAVVDRLASHIRHLREDAVDAVLVTCSTLGDATERAGSGEGAPVVRVDAAMAEHAVALAQERAADRPRVTVLATVAATMGPTTGILHRAAAAREIEIEIDVHVLGEALAARESGDQARHDALIAEAVVQAAVSADVIVLAQASMAEAAAAAATDVPILTSPASALGRVIEVARGQR